MLRVLDDDWAGPKRAWSRDKAGYSKPIQFD